LEEGVWGRNLATVEYTIGGVGCQDEARTNTNGIPKASGEKEKAETRRAGPLGAVIKLLYGSKNCLKGKARE